MSPWEILGWMIVVVIGLLLAIVLIGIVVSGGTYLKGKFTDRIHYMKTRNIAPAKGQRWKQDGSTLEIIDVYDNGRIGIRSGNASWSDDPEGWKNRVRNRKLRLISTPFIKS